MLLRGQSPSLAQQEPQRKLPQAAALARSHRFSEAEQALQDVAVPSDPNQAIAYHRLRAAIDPGLKRPSKPPRKCTPLCAYRRLGLKELANKELAQWSAAAQRVAASNEAREQSVKAFLYTMSQR